MEVLQKGTYLWAPPQTIHLTLQALILQREAFRDRAVARRRESILVLFTNRAIRVRVIMINNNSRLWWCSCCSSSNQRLSRYQTHTGPPQTLPTPR